MTIDRWRKLLKWTARMPRHGRNRPHNPPPRPFRPAIESLEVRLVPAIFIDDARVLESNGVAVVNVRAEPAPMGEPVFVDFDTQDATATAPLDYQGRSGRLTFNPGETLQQIQVPITDDAEVEPDETFFVNLAFSDVVVIADNQAVVTIRNDEASFSVSNAEVAEGNAGTTDAVFGVSLSQALPFAASVPFSTSDFSAVAGEDYQATSGIVTFAPGETEQTVTVAVFGDTVDEPDEDFQLLLDDGGAVNATVLTGDGFGLIVNDDAPLSISDFTSLEGDAGTTDFIFTVSLAGVPGLTVTVDFQTTDGTAVSPGDYTAVSGTLTFVPPDEGEGPTQQFITVTVNGDRTFERDEGFTVELSNAVNAALADPAGIGTIANDDPAPSLTIGDASALEGNSGPTTLTFTVQLSNPSFETITVEYVTADGTATAASGDYQAVMSGTLSFSPGETVQTIVVTVNGDTTFEPDETLFVNLVPPPSNGTPAAFAIADGQGIGSIVNDDPQPGVSITDVSAAEGDTGTTSFVFSVTLTNPSDQPATVDFVTQDGTALAGEDYTTTAGTLTFAPGATEATLTVQVNGDTTFEVDETFSINLGNAAGATVNDGVGIGTIQNDDGLPQIAITDAISPEGNAGPTSVLLTVMLSNPSSQPITVDFTTADGTATAPADYTPSAGTVTFAPGQTSQTVAVEVVGDLTFEPDESFLVNLTNPTNAGLADGQGQVTVLNDDPVPSVSIADATAAEGDSGSTPFVFTVTLTNLASTPIVVGFTTADATATAGVDYDASSGQLTFNPGETSQTLTVNVSGDNTTEPDEAFLINLSVPVGIGVADGQAAGTLLNDDPQPTLAIGDTAANEGNSGTTNFVFTLSLSNPTAQTVTVTIDTADGTATASSDYLAVTAATVAFAPGETVQTFTVAVLGDTTVEPDENFFVNLSQPVGAGFGEGGSAIATIVNDDTPVPPPSAPVLDPASDTGASNADAITQDNTPTFTGTATPGALVSLFAQGFGGTVFGPAVVGQATADSAGNYSITVSPPLADGSYSFSARQQDSMGNVGPLSPPLEPVVIDTAAPAVTALPLTAIEGATFMFTVATFTDLPGGTAPQGFTAAIDWGDGQTTPGTVILDPNGTLSVQGSHIYADNGSFQLTVRVTDPAGNIGAGSAPVSVGQSPLVRTPVPVCAVAGILGDDLLVLTFVDTDPGGPGSVTDFQATINWGDGTPPTPGTITLVGNTFEVRGDHTYAEEGFYTVTVLMPEGNNTVTTTTTASVFGYITSLYRNVLQREPDAGGLSFWVGQQRAGLSRDQIATVFLASAERRGLEVDQLYQTFFGHGADAGGRAFWVSSLLAGTSLTDVAIAFLTSAEYTASHPDTPSYINGLFQDVLGRPGGADAPFWQQVLNNGGRDRAAVAYFFLTSDEAYIRAIDDYYLTFLGRPVDQPTLAAIFANVVGGQTTPLTLGSAVLGSDEYLARALALACAALP